MVSDKKAIIDVVVGIMKNHVNDLSVCENGCAVIGTIFSFEETSLQNYKSDAFKVVKECSEKHKESEKIKCFFLGLMREKDKRVIDAISKGVCTKSEFPGCTAGCEFNKNLYCSKCCIQQNTYRCYECDPNKNVFYCETCWMKYHKGHKCEKFFFPIRCATET